MAYAVIERDSDLNGRYDQVPLSAARIDNFFRPISPSFFRGKAEELWKLVINGATTLDNITEALRQLNKLEIIEFRNITIDQYRPISCSNNEPQIEASRLVQLKFTSPCPDLTLSHSEEILIDFLAKRISFPTLTSIEISTSSRSRSRWRRSPLGLHPDSLNEVMNRFAPPHLTTAPLGQLLAKTCTTLHDLKLGRLKFELFKVHEIYPEILNKMSEISLKSLSFRVDSTAVDHLLKTQTKLENLTCDDGGYNDEPDAINLLSSSKSQNYLELCSAFAQCIHNCSSTLWSVKITRLVPLDGYQEGQQRWIFDLTAFRNCYNLRYLSIENTTLKDSSFVNGNFLPDSLTSLTIKVQLVMSPELTALTSRIQFLVNLRQLTVVASSQYEVNVTSLENILKATCTIGSNPGGLHDVELKNGRLPDDISAGQLQRLLCHGDNPERRYWACEIRPRGILFEKWISHDRH